MASDYASQWVLVGSVDPMIRYSGQWLAQGGPVLLEIITGSQSGPGNGPHTVVDVETWTFQPFQNISYHAEIVSSNSLSYAFNGTGAAVFGAFNDFSSSWGCFIDGIPTESFQDLEFYAQFDGEIMCAVDSLPDGPHNLSLTLDDPNAPDPLTDPIGELTPIAIIYIDKLSYLPSSNTSYSQEIPQLVAIPSANGQINYSSGWVLYTDSNTVHSTTKLNATLTIDFEGTSIAWASQSSIAYSSSLVTANATYSIDGQTPIDFLVVPPQNPLNLTDVTAAPILFNVSELSTGQHTLEVVYQGNSKSVPLALTYLVIGNNGATQNSTSSTPPSLNKRNPIDNKRVSVIVSLSIVISAIVLFSIFLWRRWSKQRVPIIADPIVHQLSRVSHHPELLFGSDTDSEPNATPVTRQRKGPGPMDLPNPRRTVDQVTPSAMEPFTLATTSTSQNFTVAMPVSAELPRASPANVLVSSAGDRPTSEAPPAAQAEDERTISDSPPEYTAA